MEYIKQMTEKDLNYLCTALTAKTLRRMMKSNLAEMEKLKKGIKPDQLSDANIINFVIKNKDNEVISEFLNLWVAYNIEKTNEYRDLLVKEGKSAGEALVLSLKEFVFADRPDLYFLTQNIPASQELLSLIKWADLLASTKEYAKPKAKPEDAKLANAKAFEEWLAAQTAKLDAKVAEAEKQSKEATQAATDAKRELAKLKGQLLQTENSKNALTQTLNETKEKLNKAQEEIKSQAESIKQKDEEIARSKEQIEAAAKSGAAKAPSPVEGRKTYEPAATMQYMSICKPYVDERGYGRLLRVADVDKNGTILENFQKDAPNLFRLYQKDGPEDQDFLGVWDWKVVPNLNNPGKGYILCSYHESMEPIEIVSAVGVHSIPEMLEKLRSGIELVLLPDRFLYVYYNGACFEGIYMIYSNMVPKDKLYALADEVQTLPVHQFPASDVIQLEGVSYLRYIDPGKPVETVKVKVDMDIVKNVMLGKVVWPALREMGYSRGDYQTIHDFIAKVPAEDAVQQISRLCGCSQEDAKAMAERFIENAGTYLNDLNVGDDDLARLIQNTPSLYQACLTKVEEKWEAEYEEKLTAAKTFLSGIEDAAKEKEAELEQLKKDAEQQRVENARLKQEADKKVVKPAPAPAPQPVPAPPAPKPAAEQKAPIVPALPALQVMPNGFTEGVPMDAQDLEINRNWEELLGTLEIELIEAGVTDETAGGLAALLFAAYNSRTPILLAGPNSAEIAKAFSISVEGRTSAVLQYAQGPGGLEACRASQSSVIMIEQPFNRKWGMEIFELVAQRQKFYIGVYPFCEYLSEVPDSFLNYFLPVITDPLVDKAPGMNYRGGKMADPFDMPPVTKEKERYGALLNELQVRPLAAHNLNQLIQDMHALRKSEQRDSDFLLLLYPLAYMTDGFAELQNFMNKLPLGVKVSTWLKNYLAPYLD